MRTDQHRVRGGGAATAATLEPDVPGRTEVQERVYRTVATHASAALIGVGSGDVRADVSQHRDGLVVRIQAPLPVPDLSDTAAIAAGDPILERARRLQEELQDRLQTILGRTITRINLTITGATTPKRRRVR